MSNFDVCSKFTGEAEGGYTNLPGDPGGETNYGISDNRDGVRDGMVSGVPGATGPVPVKALTKAQAEAIYRRDYYAPICGDQLPLPVAVAVYDYAVNSGVGTAAKALQRACSVTADGKIGPATLAKLGTLNAKSIAASVCNIRIQMLTDSTAPGVVKYRAALIARAKRCLAYSQTL